MTEATPTKRRFASLDGVRAMAAYLVVMHHVGFASGVTFHSDFGAFLTRMDVGVSIFFVLSGYLLFKPMVDAMLSGRDPLPTRKFWRRRFWRIYPSYVFALIVMLIIGAVRVGGPVGFVVAVPLVQIYHPDHAIAGLTQAWSLATEISFYFALPLFARLLIRTCRDKSPNRYAMKILFALVLVYVTSFVFRIGVNIWHPWYRNAIWHWLPSMMDIFALGMLIAVLASWSAHNTDIKASCQKIAGLAVPIFSAAVLLFVVMSTQLGLKRGLNMPGFPREMLQQTLYGIIGFMVVLPFALGPEIKTILHRFFGLRPIAWVGLVSYGVYLWHELLIAGNLGEKHMPWKLFDDNFAGRLGAVTVVTLIIAAVNYYFLEEPIARKFS